LFIFFLPVSLFLAVFVFHITLALCLYSILFYQAPPKLENVAELLEDVIKPLSNLKVDAG